MDKAKKFAVIHGSSIGNPGPSGWAALVTMPDGSYQVVGAPIGEGTNNSSILAAAVGCLEKVADGESFTLCTDSTYLSESVNLGRMSEWRKKRWQKGGKPIPNAAYWAKLDDEMKRVHVEIAAADKSTDEYKIAQALAASYAYRSRLGIKG